MAKTKSKTKIKKPLLNQEEAHEITSEYLKKVDGGGYTTDMEVSMMSPFGPHMLKAKLPDKLFDHMMELTDDITNDVEKTNWGHALAGQVEDEPVITNDRLIEEGLYDWFNNLVRYYCEEHVRLNRCVMKMKEPALENYLTSMWIVNQKENEYNPVHHHTNATVSCVFYLKIPEYKPRDLPYKQKSDGQIEFIYQATGEEHSTLAKGCYLTNPEPGDLYMFPSYLLHTVYPFIGEGERRSVSFNAVHHWYDKDMLHKEQLAKAHEEKETLKSELDELKEQVAQLAKAK